MSFLYDGSDLLLGSRCWLNGLNSRGVVCQDVLVTSDMLDIKLEGTQGGHPGHHGSVPLRMILRGKGGRNSFVVDMQCEFLSGKVVLKLLDEVRGRE